MEAWNHSSGLETATLQPRSAAWSDRVTARPSSQMTTQLAAAATADTISSAFSTLVSELTTRAQAMSARYPGGCGL